MREVGVNVISNREKMRADADGGVCLDIINGTTFRCLPQMWQTANHLLIPPL